MTPKQIIIDGYNVLGAMGLPPRRILENGEQVREEFIVRVGLYGQRLNCPVTLVFDAWQQSQKDSRIIHRAGVTVIYTGQGQQADYVIQQLIRTHGKEAAVVSSDGEIIQVAKTFGAFSIPSQQFMIRLNPGGTREAYRNRIKDGAGPKDGDQIPVPAKEKKGNPRKLPKKLRQRNRIMRKF